MYMFCMCLDNFVSIIIQLKEKSRDLNRNSSRFFFQIQNETMFDSGYENCPEFGVLGDVIFKLDIL
jgi:hypothetical protein